MKPAKNIFFETYSLLQVLALSWRIRSTERIIFCRPGLLPQSPRWKKELIKGFIRFLNSKATIQEVSIEEITEEIWQLNKQGVGQVERLTEKIKQSPAYCFGLRLIRDENVMQYYKGGLAREIPAQVFFLMTAKKLMTRLGYVLIVPKYNEYLHVQIENSQEGLATWALPRVLQIVNQIRLFLSQCGQILFLTLFPFAYLLMHLFNGFKWGARPKFKLLMPVIWGFRDTTDLSAMAKKDYSDEYFYGDTFKPGEILHTFGDWPLEAPVRHQYQETMKKRGYAFVEKKKYKLSLKFLKDVIRVLKICILSWRSLLSTVSTLDGLLLGTLPKLVHRYLRKKLEIENVDCEAESIRNDYDPGHVLSTILANQEGKRTVGIQHAASPYDCPQLHYVHVDCYVIYGEFYVKLFAPYWDHLRLARIGREKLDSLALILANDVLRSKIQDRAIRLFGESKHIALVLFPGAAEICLQKQWNEIYEGLREVSKTDLDAKIFLRFRDISHLEKFSCLSRLAELSLHDRRFILDHSNFTTSELMSISDMTIVPQASFTLSESIITEAKTFTFEYTGAAKFYFSHYGKDLILRSARDVLRTFHGLEQGYEGFDCQWDDLRKDLNYYADGDNARRLQEVILKDMPYTQEATHGGVVVSPQHSYTDSRVN